MKPVLPLPSPLVINDSFSLLAAPSSLLPCLKPSILHLLFHHGVQPPPPSPVPASLLNALVVEEHEAAAGWDAAAEHFRRGLAGRRDTGAGRQTVRLSVFQ